ncbi:hypothetical protein IJ182_08890 [bacterium]|nr:hypothetical protein [bacterium]
MAVLQEKTTATVKKGVAYFEGDSFTLSNVDKVKTIDFSKYAYASSLSFSRSDKDLLVKYSGRTVTIKDYFNSKGAVVSTVKTIRGYDSSAKKRYKDYNLTTSGLLNHIESGVESFDIKKGVITGTPFADTISAAGFNKPTGKNKDTGVTIKTGNGNDEITGSSYKDTFNITGSGTKTINIGADDGDDTIKGINTKNAALILNLSNTVLDNATNAAANATYEKVGNDLKITASETTPSKIENLNNYIWYKQYMGYDSTTGKSIYQYGVSTSDNPTYNYYEYNPHSFETPLYSYEEGGETKYTEYRDITHTLADAYLLVGYNAYDGNQSTPDGDIYKIFTNLEAANAFKDSYYQTGGYYDESSDICEIKKLSDLTPNAEGKKILCKYYVCDGHGDSTLTYSESKSFIKYSDMYLRNNGILVTEEQKQDGDIKLSELSTDILYLNDENKFSTTFPSGHRYTSISKDDFDKVYYLSSDILCVRDYIEYDVNETYYKYNEQDYSYTENRAPNEIAGNCTIVDTQAPVYTTVDTIYSYVKDGSMAYSFDAQTANYVEGATAPASSTTIIKDYFKNLVAPYVEIGLKNVQLLEVLNKTDLVNIDRSAQTKKQTIKGSFLNDVITGGQGNDTINLASGNDIVNAGKGNDTINIKVAGTKIITIANDDGNDTITGTSVPGSGTLLNFTDIDVDSVSDAKNNLEYTRSKNNLVIKRTYTVDGKEKTSTTTIKDYFKSSTLTPNVYLGDINTQVSLYSVLNGFNAGTKGTHLNDILTGTKKADKITTGIGTDTITGGKGNDKITIDGNGSKYIVMNTGDGVDTVSTKANDYIYLQFKGAGITNDSTAKTNLTYEKSGKNDIKITSTVEASAIIAPTGYISNTGIDTDKISYYYSCASGSYYTKITEDTGLYSYETDGETRYTTEKNETVKLNTAKLVQTRNRYTEITDSVGFLTDSSNYSASTEDYIVTDLSNEAITKLYAYKSKTYTGIYEYVYSTKNDIAIKYSDLWLKKPYSDSNYYVFTTEKENDDCIQVSSLDKIYHWYDSVKLESTSDTYEEITNDKFDSIYYIDKNHTYIADIDNNNTTPIYKEFDISSSYYLELPDPHYYSTDRGMAVTGALTENSYKKIDNIYKTTDDEGKVALSLDKPENFKEDISSTSVIIKDYLTKGQSVLITNSDNTSSARWLSSMLYDIGVNIGNANSKKAQKLTGSNLNDNIYGGSGKDKITTGASNSWNRGDIITPGKGNDTITINGNGNKTINIANKDGNDTIIFTDNNKKTTYDYTTSKMLYLNFDDDAELTYSMKGKDLVINRSYANGTKTAAATTTLKDYFNVDYKSALARNIYINNSLFDPSEYFDNKEIDKSSGKKAQKINGNMFANIITGGSANDTINGCGGNDVIDGKNGSDTYVVNYNSGSKYYLYDTITINDSGNGAKDVDTLKLDIKKKDLGLLFNISKITNPNAYTDNDIVVGSGNDAIHYLMDNQWMIVTNFSSLDDVEIISEKVKMEHGIFATGLEKITTSDKKNITLANIKTIAQDVANWLSTANNGAGYDSTAAVYASGNSDALITMLSKYNPDNAVIKEYMNNL